MLIEEKLEKNSGTDWWAERTKRLLIEQTSAWPLLKNNYENLANIQIRKFLFDDFEIKIQFNPDRIISSSADVSDKAIKARKCFLCQENLPTEQNSLVYNKHFYILVNPYPIFPEHFTISKRNHTPQTIIGNFEELLDLTRSIGKYYTIFYNGPKCGSSAPDHMHFQAGTKNIMPVEYEFNKMVNMLPRAVVGNGKIEVRFFENFLRYFISFESRDKGELLFAFKTFVNSFKKISAPHNEPMMNLTVSFQEDVWRLIIFPRQVHRPVQFFEDVKNQLLISPAAVDMGGLFIAPRLEDFEKLKKEDVINIFKQVTIPKEYFEFLRKKIGEIFI
ncbi:MAG: DUF4922 domain-containing protein [Ignavibacteriales bacterium]|nr:DUF4922 domain-containing protein [Ignavibacteriales bacterium]